MSVMGASAAGAAGAATGSGAREPRVRDLAREAVTLMAFSAAASLLVFLVVLLGFWLGN